MFLNRSKETAALLSQVGKGVFGYVTGRRRVGKTALLREICDRKKGFYHQAIEGPVSLQLEHLAGEMKTICPVFSQVIPKSWTEFFALLGRDPLPSLLVFDEFPYWVASDPSLASILQKWVDHDLPKLKTSLYLSGSSQAMLYSQFLDQSAPLYGRSKMHLHLKPMSYSWFSRYRRQSADNPETFELFSLVGGVPHYWTLLAKGSCVSNADRLYFSDSALLNQEPRIMLNDEGINGIIPRGILDLVGRGVSKPSEIASRLGLPQNHLPRPMSVLLELGFVQRELPFGESTKTSKKTLYRVNDAALSFYYGTLLPHQREWPVMGTAEKKRLIHEHASRQWEVFCREVFPGSARYWESDIELDIVAPLSGGRFLVAECKWKKLSVKDEQVLLADLERNFKRSQLSKKLGGKIIFRILSQNVLPEMAKKLAD